MNVLEYVDSVPRNLATEALYYCLRALKQAILPSESKKDYFFDTKSSNPSAESIAIARTILRGIEKTEDMELDRMNPSQLKFYIVEIGRVTDLLSSRVDGFSVEKGAELLRRMRST